MERKREKGDPFDWLDDPDAEKEAEVSHLGDMTAIKLHPGDIVVVKTDDYDLLEKISRLKANMPSLATVDFIGVPKDVDIGVLRREKTIDEARVMVRSILKWAEDHPKFKTEFVKACEERIKASGRLTERQFVGLSKIMTRFGIPVREESPLRKKLRKTDREYREEARKRREKLREDDK